MNEEIDYDIFIDCTPLHNYVPNDPILEALQNQRRHGQVEGAPPAVEALPPDQPQNAAGGKRRSQNDKRNAWLPADWHVEREVRLRGKKAGCYDSIYVDPDGNRYRSKKRVLKFLENGIPPRRKAKNKAKTATKNAGEGSKGKRPSMPSSDSAAVSEQQLAATGNLAQKSDE